jgi:glycosyltransferase involved in cell wall biosynthesis
VTSPARSLGREHPNGDAPRVVFLGHNASRSGAPIALLHLLRWLRRENALHNELVLLAGGPLLPAYRGVLPTSVVAVDGLRARLLWVVDRVGGRVASHGIGAPPRVADRTVVRRATAACSTADLVYANSIETGSVLHGLRVRPPTILHIHEMSYGLRYSAYRSPMRTGLSEDEYLQKTLQLADVLLVPSEATREQLLAIAPGARERCTVIPEMIDVSSVRAELGETLEIRERLSIPKNALIVVGCGAFDWRKGTDFFVQVAARVASTIRSQPVYWVWIGAPTGPAYGTRAWLQRRHFDFDVQSLALDERMILVPPTPEALSYIAVGDVFLLPSREDPFPLVALEAAALGKPVVCFDSSGTASMIGHDAGAVVPHFDVVAMSAAVQRFLADSPLRTSAGLVAARRAAAFDVSEIAPRVFGAMSSLLRQPSGTGA